MILSLITLSFSSQTIIDNYKITFDRTLHEIKKYYFNISLTFNINKCVMRILPCGTLGLDSKYQGNYCETFLIFQT